MFVHVFAIVLSFRVYLVSLFSFFFSFFVLVNFEAVIKSAASAASQRPNQVNQGSEWSIKGQNGQSRVRMVNLESE